MSTAARESIVDGLWTIPGEAI
ncbi:hypothetical protein CBM2585_A40358 [Cupriavidus taiwanensis]|nr:hypothetical protein CBM2585_A40358 [Cupriavidus taiwanensis]